MAGFIRYEQAPVNITGNGKSCDLLATTVTAGENLPLQAVRALGYNGAVAVTGNGPVDGTWSTTFHLVKKSMGPSAVCSGASTEPDGDCEDFNKGKALTWGFDKPLTLKVGATPLFSKGIANSFTVTAEPNAIITATMGGNFYDCRMTPKGGSVSGASVGVGNGDLAVAHGSESGLGASVDLGFQCDAFSASYEASRGFNPIYSLGSLTAKFVMITDPQQSITLQGENIPKSVLADGVDCATGHPLCLKVTDAAFNVADVCGQAIATYDVCGFVQSRDIEVAENDVLRGNITVVDYAFAQSIGSASC